MNGPEVQEEAASSCKQDCHPPCRELEPAKRQCRQNVQCHSSRDKRGRSTADTHERRHQHEGSSQNARSTSMRPLPPGKPTNLRLDLSPHHRLHHEEQDGGVGDRPEQVDA